MSIFAVPYIIITSACSITAIVFILDKSLEVCIAFLKEVTFQSTVIWLLIIPFAWPVPVSLALAWVVLQLRLIRAEVVKQRKLEEEKGFMSREDNNTENGTRLQ